jgi:hypothetical protein
MTIIVDIDKAEERAQRSLDGMTYNRDQMARDVIGMAAELRNWRAAFERMKTRSNDPGFSGVFKDVFGDMFDKK